MNGNSRLSELDQPMNRYMISYFIGLLAVNYALLKNEFFSLSLSYPLSLAIGAFLTWQIRMKLWRWVQKEHKPTCWCVFNRVMVCGHGMFLVFVVSSVIVHAFLRGIIDGDHAFFKDLWHGSDSVVYRTIFYHYLGALPVIVYFAALVSWQSRPSH